MTNPPIDPIREELVMSLVSFVGPKPNLLNTTDINPPIRLEVSQPVLTCTNMEKLRHIEKYTAGKFKSLELDICYPVAWGKAGIEARLASLAADAEDAVRSGANVLIVSDRKVDADHVAIPALLATSAIHQHLVKKACGPVLAWWLKPARHVRRTTSHCSAVMVLKLCIPIWHSKLSSPWPKVMLQQPRSMFITTSRRSARG